VSVFLSVCFCVCVCAWVCVRVSVWVFLSVSEYVCVWMSVCFWVCFCVCVRVWVWVSEWVCVCMCVHMWVCVCVCVNGVQSASALVSFQLFISVRMKTILLWSPSHSHSSISSSLFPSSLHHTRTHRPDIVKNNISYTGTEVLFIIKWMTLIQMLSSEKYIYKVNKIIIIIIIIIIINYVKTF